MPVICQTKAGLLRRQKACSLQSSRMYSLEPDYQRTGVGLGHPHPTPMTRVGTKHPDSKSGLPTHSKYKLHSILLDPVSRTLGLPQSLHKSIKIGNKRTERASVCLNRLLTQQLHPIKKNLYPNTCTLCQTPIKMFITALIITVKNKNKLNANL